MNKNSNVLMLLSLTLVSGCASYKKYESPPVIEKSDQVNITTDADKRLNSIAPVLKWWESLNDDQLNSLIILALEKNKDIEIGIANLAEARGVSLETNYGNTPSISVSGSGQRVRTSGNQNGESATTNNNFQAGFDAIWELDFFGRVSEGIKASDARADAANEDLRYLYVTVASEVARNYIELRGAQYRLDITLRNALNQRETYKLTKVLTDAGKGTKLDITRAQAQLELTESNLPSLEAQVTQLTYRLSVLTGQLPDALQSELTGVKPLPSIPDSVNVGDVSELLRRRPDIRAMERRLAASVADYNITIADQFPKVSITGILGFASTRLSDFSSSAASGSVGPSVSWSGLDTRRIKARINQGDARIEAAIASYEKQVLEAIEELQTSISNFSKEEQRRLKLQSSARLSKEASELARQRYDAGLDTFIDVLSAEATLLVAEDGLALSEINAAINLIAIYKALGGGWEFKSP